MKSPKHRTLQAAFIAKAKNSHFQRVADRNRKIQPMTLVKPAKAAPVIEPEITPEPAAPESTPPKE